MNFIDIVASVSILICIILMIIVPILHLVFYARFNNKEDSYLFDKYHISDNLYSKEFFNNLELSAPIISYIVLISLYILLYILKKTGSVNIVPYFNYFNDNYSFYVIFLFTILMIMYLVIYYPILYEIYVLKKNINNNVILFTSEEYLEKIVGKNLSEYNSVFFENAMKVHIADEKIFSTNIYTEAVKYLCTHYLLLLIQKCESDNDGREKLTISKDMFYKINIVKYIKIDNLYDRLPHLRQEPLKNILNSIVNNRDKKVFIEKIYYNYLKNTNILITDINVLSKKYNKINSPIIISIAILMFFVIFSYINRNKLKVQSFKIFFEKSIELIAKLIVSKKVDC
jgi:hypothetical protein